MRMRKGHSLKCHCQEFKLFAFDPCINNWVLALAVCNAAQYSVDKLRNTLSTSLGNNVQPPRITNINCVNREPIGFAAAKPSSQSAKRKIDGERMFARDGKLEFKLTREEYEEKGLLSIS